MRLFSLLLGLISVLLLSACTNSVEFTINFDSNGGSEVNPQYVQKDNTIAIPNTSKVGYTLDGWYTSLNNGQTFDEKWSFTNNKVTTDITLYAKWIINQYTITFNSNGGSSVSSITQDYDTLVIAPANPTKLGYTFSGWSQPVPIKMPAEDVTLIAEWSINQYTITFNSNGGSPVTAITQDYATTVSKPTDPTKVGYTFAGWYSDSNLSTAYTFTTMPAEDITLYAKWNIITYNINYELDGGFTSGNPTAYTVDTNTITLTIPTKEGYTFDGWYLESEFVTVKTQIIKGTVGNLTLYAKWTLNSYTLSFNSNGGSPVTAVTQDYATTVSKPTDPTKVGYTFAGWYINSSLTTAYTFTTMPAEDITLYAKWNIITYSINYELADGLNHLSNPSSYTIETNTIILSAPTKEGYTFEGWYSDEQYTVEVLEITQGSIGDITLYAKWNINSYEINYQIQYSELYDISLLPGETIIQVSLGQPHSAALTSNGRLFTWGYNADGQLGDGTTTDRSTPTEITNRFSLATGDKIIQVSLGRYHSAALTSSGRLFIWGRNHYGQLGDGTNTYKYTPTEITSQFSLSTGDQIISVSVGGAHSAALTSSGRLFTWGYNYYGYLGDGTNTDKYTPTEITSQFSLSTGDKIIQVSLGSSHSAALTSSGRLFTWGSNYVGQLGDGTTTERYSPTQITQAHYELLHSDTVIYNQSIMEYVPLRDGYTFSGWYSDINLNTPYIFGSMPAEDITLHGKWVSND